MKVVQINTVSGRGSTGKICEGISEALNEAGIENYILCSSASKIRNNTIEMMPSKFYPKLQALKSRLFGNYGFNSLIETKRIISKLEELKPDVVQLHNIHGHDCNIAMLFDYLREKQIKVYWTFHDCWAFTGYCTHFTIAKCDKWKCECHNCPQFRKYSWIFDRSSEMYRRKKEMIRGVDLTVITPSRWLAELAKQSFFKDCDVRVINNGIDLSIFKPTQSNFRKEHGIGDEQIMLLGVADRWGFPKGLDVFTELSKRLDSERYRIVLVGTDNRIDKLLPENIVSIHRTQNQIQLAEIYTAADIFLNPTREEVLGLVNIEALACGTPVITFNTGGSPECIDETCGRIVVNNSICAMESDIAAFIDFLPSFTACVDHSKLFDDSQQYTKYCDTYMRGSL